MLRAVCVAFLLGLPLLRAASPVLTLENTLLPTPAGVGASNPGLSETPNGLLLAWTTSSGATQNAIFNPSTGTWKETPATTTASTSRTTEILVKRAGRAAKAWFDPTPKDPSIQLSVQPNSQDHFLLPVRIEDGRPCGAPSVVLLSDGTVFVSWPEHYNQNETALWLRRVSPGGSLSVPVLLAVLPENPASLQLALVTGLDHKPAQFLLAYSIGDGETAQIATRLLTVTPATNEVRHSPCNTCPDPDETARGYGIRGEITAFSVENATITLKHSSLNGVIEAGATDFKVDPAILQTAAIGKELFARIEKRGDDWWLFAPSWIVRTTP